MKALRHPLRTLGRARPFSRMNPKLGLNWPGGSGQPETRPAIRRKPGETYGRGAVTEGPARRAWSFGAIPVVLNQHLFKSRFFDREVSYGKGREKRRQRSELSRHAKHPSA